MKSNDTVENLVTQLRYRAAPEFRQRACENMLAALDVAGPTKPRTLWRIVMTSKTTYCVTAVAAAVVLAFVLLPVGGPLDRQGVVLAEVVKKTEAFDTLTHREKRVFYMLGEKKNEPPITTNVVRKASSRFGIVERQYDTDGRLMYIAYILKKEKRLILVCPDTKKYSEIPLPDEAVALMNDFSPKGIVRLLTRHGFTRLEPKEIDGRKAEGFQMSGKQVEDVLSMYNYKKYKFVFPIEKLTMRLWVDVETSLPVRTEWDMTTGRGLMTGGGRLRCHWEDYDVDWGAKVDPKEFEPNIPDDYTRVELTPPEISGDKDAKKNPKEPSSQPK